MKVKLLDEAGYLIQGMEVAEPLTPVLIWGDRIFLRLSKRRYREVRYRVLSETTQMFRMRDKVGPDGKPEKAEG